MCRVDASHYIDSMTVDSYVFVFACVSFPPRQRSMLVAFSCWLLVEQDVVWIHQIKSIQLVKH